MKAEEEFISRPNRRLAIWVDFYETRLTDKVLVEFLASIHHSQSHIAKLAIVGWSLVDRLRYAFYKRKSGMELSIPVKFFADPEDAKTWLVDEAK